MNNIKLDSDDFNLKSPENITNNIISSNFFDMLINNKSYRKAELVELKSNRTTPTTTITHPPSGSINIEDLQDTSLDEKLGWIVVRYITNQNYKDDLELLKSCNSIRDSLLKRLNNSNTKNNTNKLLLEYLKSYPKISDTLKAEILKCSRIVEDYNIELRNTKDNKKLEKYIKKL